MATNQRQGQPPNPGRAKAIAANSRFFSRALGGGLKGLRRPGKSAKKAGQK